MTVMLLPKVSNDTALKAVKDRFVRLSSNTSHARFRDLITGIDQSDPDILRFYYHKIGGKDSLSSQDLVQRLDFQLGESFQPNAPRMLPGYMVNLWNPPTIQASGSKVRSDQVPLFLEFMERWFPIEEERTYFMWWVAHTIRRPDVRLVATPLLRSEHGTGKGFFAETLMAGLMHQSSVAVASLKDVVGDFNDVIEGKTLVVIDEVYKSKKSTTDSLKSIQGNRTLALRRKHKPVCVIQNYINFIITSNDHIPLTLENGDRRFWVPQFLKHKVDLTETDGFLNKRFKPWLEKEGGFQLVRDYLEQGDLDKYSPSHCPMTESKKDMLGFTTEEKLAEVLAEALEMTAVFTVGLVRERLPRELQTVSDATIASTLLSLGCIRKNTTKARYYITPTGQIKGLSKTTAPKELEEHLPAQKDF